MERAKLTLADLSRIYWVAILIIDDDKEYVNEIYKQAKDFHIDIRAKASLEEAKEYLSSDEGKEIKGVILDIICLKSRDQDVPDNTFIITASQYFARAYPHMPVVALTGETEQYKSMGHLFKDDMKVFSKGGDEEKMFEYLREKALDLDKMKIRANYRDIFEVIDQYFDKEAEGMLVSCIRDMMSDDEKIITGTMGTLRKLQEKFYIALHKKNREMVPREMVFGPKDDIRINNDGIIRHLTGNYKNDMGITTTREYVKYDSHLYRLLRFVYKGCSGSLHVSTERASRYTVQALVTAFLDLLLWLRMA